MPRTAEIGATRDSYVYRLRLPAQLKEQWDEHCAKQDKSPSVVMRALMRYIIQDDMPPEVRRWIAEETERVTDTGPKERLRVSFTPSEHAALLRLAEAEACSPQRWVVNCVRASLTNKPQFTMETAKALWESSAQLRAIGRNLNQITKRLHETGELSVRVERIEQLSTIIDGHREKVADLLNASLTRWVIADEND